jgi:predicted dithiol-disulfide oxidoreductase (DUF899 family)
MNRNPLSAIEKEIVDLENGMKETKAKLAELRRKAPQKEVENYIFTNSFGTSSKLSDLFGTKDELILIHNMGVGCPYCTLWADGFNGVLKHLENRAAFVLESPDEVSVQRQFAADRGWKFQMVSSRGTSFRKDMGYADEKGSPMPGTSIFTKSKDGKIKRVSDTGFGPHDNYCVVWDLFDLLPKAEAEIKFHYAKAK